MSRSGAILVLALLAAASSPAQPARAQDQVPLDPGLVPKFVEPLPMPLRVDVTATSPVSPLVVTLNEFQQKVLPNSFYTALPAPYDAGTYLWCYQAAGWPQTFPGPTFVARVGVPTTLRYVNNLVGPGGRPPFLQGLIKVDQTLHWADPLGQHGSTDAYVGPVPAVTHLHGGEVPSAFDGGPDAWWTPDKTYVGPGYVTDTYTYPNQQQATTLWYHDHVLGATRTNVYVGLAGFYLLRDPAGEPSNLPGGSADTPSDQYGNLYEREVVIQDRTFDTDGQLLFPGEGDDPTVHPFWNPESFGDVIMVNGKTWPYLQVEPRRYRFRFLDGSNARFYELRLMARSMKTPGPALWQIGSDGGLLDAPVKLNDPLVAKPPRLLIAPGERADLVVDFAGYAGQTLVLVNGAKAPYPKGEAADPKTTALIMQLRVGTTVTGGADPSLDPAATAGLRSKPIERPAGGAAARALTLNEVQGEFGPLEMFVNNTAWDLPATENLAVGGTEVWEIVNLTADTHPFHFHLVQFQLLNRQPFNTTRYMGAYGAPEPGSGPPLAYGVASAATGFKLGGNPDVTPFLQGPPVPPDPSESGWKDTFRMNPGEVTRVIVRVAPQDAVEKAGGPVTAGMNLFPFDPAAGLGVADDGFGFPGGPGYVWHCHIIDHEDNEMMRRLIVTTPATLAARAAASAPAVAGAAAAGGSVELGTSRPNPAVGRANIAFSLPRAGEVELAIFDVNGRLVRRVASGTFAAGAHSVEWDGRDAAGNAVPGGAYFYRLRAGEASRVRRLAYLP